MISPRKSIFTLFLAFFAGGCWGQVLQDPMQPPAFVVRPGTDSSESAPFGPILQSTLLSSGRRIAMIDGKPMKIGDRIGGARIVSIDPASVTLRDGRETRVLELFHGIRITPTQAEKVSVVPVKPGPSRRLPSPSKGQSTK